MCIRDRDSIVTAFPEEFLVNWNVTPALVDQHLESFEAVNLKDLNEGAKTLQGFQPWSVQGHGLLGVWIVLVVVATVMGTLIVALCLWRKRMAMLWSLTGSANREGAVSWNRLSSKQVELHENLDQLKTLIRNMQQSSNNREENGEEFLQD